MATSPVSAANSKQEKTPKQRPQFPPPSSFRDDFPKDFMFGSSTSAFQVEGAVDKKYGRGESIWDVFCREKGLFGWENAANHYHKYQEDVRIMKYMNLDTYRFSISWSRVLPMGRTSGGINSQGVDFYHKLLHELEEHKITPIVTLFHFEVPEALEKEYKGFNPDEKDSGKIVKDFCDFTNFCFEQYGSKVKHWITFNEPYSFSYFGYGIGAIAPGYGYPPKTVGNTNVIPTSRYYTPQAQAIAKEGTHEGDPARDPYNVSRHQLLCHAHAYDLYKKKYKETQGGQIGMTLNSIWAIPSSNSTSDLNAAQRALDFMFGWFMEPLHNGKYPESMVKLVGNRLKSFSPEESALLKGSYDFLGLNYYTTNYVALEDNFSTDQPHVATDGRFKCTTTKEGIPIGYEGASNWIYGYPRGLLELLHYIGRKYDKPSILITENGIDQKKDDSIEIWEALSDHLRLEYYHQHLCYLKRAIEDYSDLKGSREGKIMGYLTWSLMDNFEWSSSTACRFGNIFVDYSRDYKRYPKITAEWLRYHLAPVKYTPPATEE